MNRHYKQTTWVEVVATREEVDVTVEFTVTGKHLRATRLDPAEEPEAEIDRIVGPGGKVLTMREITPASQERLDAMLDEWATEAEQGAQEEADERRADEADEERPRRRRA